jgi:hypothetical protein
MMKARTLRRRWSGRDDIGPTGSHTFRSWRRRDGVGLRSARRYAELHRKRAVTASVIHRPNVNRLSCEPLSRLAAAGAARCLPPMTWFLKEWRPASSVTPLRYCSTEPLQRRTRNGGSSATGSSCAAVRVFRADSRKADRSRRLCRQSGQRRFSEQWPALRTAAASGERLGSTNLRLARRRNGDAVGVRLSRSA